MPFTATDLGDIFDGPGLTSFRGEGFQQAKIYATKEEAIAARDNVVSGGKDPFLKDAYDGSRITRNRDFEGNFAKGWALILNFKRPAEGQAYDLAGPQTEPAKL